MFRSGQARPESAKTFPLPARDCGRLSIDQGVTPTTRPGTDRPRTADRIASARADFASVYTRLPADARLGSRWRSLDAQSPAAEQTEKTQKHGEHANGLLSPKPKVLRGSSFGERQGFVGRLLTKTETFDALCSLPCSGLSWIAFRLAETPAETWLGVLLELEFFVSFREKLGDYRRIALGLNSEVKVSRHHIFRLVAVSSSPPGPSIGAVYSRGLTVFKTN